jgi:hypothetical protein
MTDDPLKINKEIGRLMRQLGRSLKTERRAKVVNRITELRCALRLVCAGIQHFDATLSSTRLDLAVQPVGTSATLTTGSGAG